MITGTGKLPRAIRLLVLALAFAGSLAFTTSASARVLRVAQSHPPGTAAAQFNSIQAAVDAARPGDWILIAPGDYHERGDYTTHQPTDEAGAGVLITTPNIHLRGLDRNGVVVDGTKPGSPKCSSAAGNQDFGPNGLGRNGVEVFKADGVTVENITACNFLDGSGGGGNQIWFNGGDGSGQVGMGPFGGDFLSATSTFYGGSGAPAGTYGIFTSNSRGPGVIDHSYASNMNDASYYIGACPDCNQVLTHAHAQGSALGYSGTNSGGHLVIENSEWDLNNTGIVTNSQNNDDAPSPQVGLCPGSATQSCTIFRNNFIHNNNNPNVPSAGSASLGPPGTGIVISGGRFDTVTQNQITDNGAWGVLLTSFPDDTRPPLDTPSHCQGGILNFEIVPGLSIACYYDDWGNEVSNNSLSGNGFFGNETNGDLAEISQPHDPGNCWHGNFHPDGSPVTSAPANLQVTHATCGVPNQGASLFDPLAAQVICATQAFGPCPADTPGMMYPRPTNVQMLPLPAQPSMPSPCAGVPNTPWCKNPHGAG
ncbi:MAG TPA: hypothetical protein VF256_00565 [Streptosporangiaceae bacterium]